MSNNFEDLGQLNQSLVYLPSIKFTLPQTNNISNNIKKFNENIGLYEEFKLTNLTYHQNGQLIQFINFDAASGNTFITNQAQQLLQSYLTCQIAFIFVVGNKKAGKSFFCDKILNLSQIRGNHFCRKRQIGINVWSNPFIRQNLKIFLGEINGCYIQSPEFKILATYGLLIGSCFAIIQNIDNKNEKSNLFKFNKVIEEINQQISSSNQLNKQNNKQSHRQIFMPNLYYDLYRQQNNAKLQELDVVKQYFSQNLPNALSKSHKGKQQDMLHTSFLDKSCINENYIKRVSQIFKQIYKKITDKKYYELQMNGNICLKVIKNIQNYVINRQKIHIQDIYQNIIKQLYLSAYNYCILSYHEQMQKALQNEHPHSIQQLIQIFDTSTNSVLSKFQEFTLDQNLYEQYLQKLEKHINQKQKIILYINQQKTQQVLLNNYDSKEMTSIATFNNSVQNINKKYPQLNHNRVKSISKISGDLYKNIKANPQQLKINNQIKKFQNQIKNKNNQLQQILASNQQKMKKQTLMNKQQQNLLNKERKLDTNIQKIIKQIEQIKQISRMDSTSLLQSIKMQQKTIQKNKQIINELQKPQQKSDPKIQQIQKKIQLTRSKIAAQQNLLQTLAQNKNNTLNISSSNPNKPNQSKKSIK